jgi:hypothetical protein
MEDGQFTLSHTLPDAKGKEESDHYPSPPLLAQCGVEIAVTLFGGHPRGIIEPGCSERAPFAVAARRMGIQAQGIEFRKVIDNASDEAKSLIIDGKDFLDAPLMTMTSVPPDIIITNPPFTYAVEFVKKAVNEVTDRGLVIMLLQTGIEGSQKRREFWASYPPVFRYVIRPRPGFTWGVKGNSDSREYAYYVWLSPIFTKRLITMGRMITETRYLDNEGPWGRAD